MEDLHFTNLLISVCVAVFLVEILTQYFYGFSFIDDFGFSLKNLMDMKLWTFFTSIFIHAGPEHLLFNMIALYFFGRVVEEQLGWRKYIAIFFGTAFAGELVILLLSFLGMYSPVVPTVGASAGIFGLLAVSMFLRPLEFVIYPYIVPVPIILIAIIYILYNIVGFLAVAVTGEPSEISYAAHIGGLTAGLLIGLKIEGKRRGILLMLAFIFVLMAILIFWKYISILEATNYVSIFSRAVR